MHSGARAIPRLMAVSALAAMVGVPTAAAGEASGNPDAAVQAGSANESADADDAVTTEGPAAPVRRLSDTLIATMKDAKTLGFDGRRDRLAPVLRETFDFGFMAQLALGSQWSRLDTDERTRFTELFGDMSVATFAARFDGYGGQRFELQEPREGPRGTKLVPTKLVHPDSEKAPVTISYLVRKTDTGWQAVDVYLKGTYSELATKRSEYTSILRREGYDALVRRIRDKIAELRETGDPGEAPEDPAERDGA